VSDLNQFCCTGRLTRDPEVRFLANDKCVAGFALAISHTYTKDNAKHEDTLFLDCEAWGKLGEIIGQYLTKGKQVAVAGRLKLDTWEDKNGGGKRSKVKLVAESMTMLGSKPEASSGAPAPAASAPRVPTRPQEEPASQDDPPF